MRFGEHLQLNVLFFGAVLSGAILTGACNETTSGPVDASRDAIASGDARPDRTAPEVRTPCTTDTTCDDSIACTRDRCIAGFCDRAPLPEMCDNRVFCDGLEVCMPGRGCIPGPPTTCSDENVCTLDACNETSDTCEHRARDLDNDGEIDWNCMSGTDCADLDERRGMQRTEICGDLVDNNCDERIDEATCGAAPGDRCETAIDVSAGGTFNIALAGTSQQYTLPCWSTPNKDVVAKFTLSEAKDVDIVSSVSGDIAISAIRRGCDGAPLQCDVGGTSRIRQRALPPGEYFVFVATTSPLAMSVDLLVTFSPASPAPTNETCSNATDVSAGGRFPFSFVGVTDDVRLACGFTGSPDLLYRFTLTETKDVVLTATTDSLETVRFEVRSGCETTARSLKCTSGGITATSRVRSLGAGTYYVAVEPGATRAFDGTLIVAFGPPSEPPIGDTCERPETLALNATVTGRFAGREDDVRTCYTEAKDVVYAFTLTETSDVSVSINANGFLVSHIITSVCTPMPPLFRCEFANDSMPRRYPQLAAGTYYLVIDTSGSPEYTLQVTTTRSRTPTAVTGNDTCGAQAVEVPATGGAFSGTTVGFANDATSNMFCGAGSRGPDATFLVRLTAALPHIQATAVGTGFPVTLSIRGVECAAGAEFFCADQQVQGSIATFLDSTLPAGDYMLTVDGPEGMSGSYLLDISYRSP